MSLMLAAVPVAAAEEGATVLNAAIVTSAGSLVVGSVPAPSITLPTGFVDPARPRLLLPLYTASALLQGIDTYSTLTALETGGVEANPMMRSVAKSPAAFVAIKVGVTASTILIAERLWKDNHRFGAVMMMVISNSAMVMVAAHNASTMRRLP